MKKTVILLFSFIFLFTSCRVANTDEYITAGEIPAVILAEEPTAASEPEPEDSTAEPGEEPVPQRQIIPPKQAEALDYSAAAALVLETVEAAHPIFIMEGLLPGYYGDYREEYLAATARPVTRTAFVLATQRYFTVLKDGHMGGGYIGVRQPNGLYSPHQDGGYVNRTFTARDSRLYLQEEPHIEVLEIGGIPVTDIFYQIDRYYYPENEADRMFKYAYFSRYELMLRLAGAEIYMERLPHTDLTLSGNGGIFTMAVAVSGSAPVRFSSPHAGYIISHEMINDVFYIDLRQFTDGPHITETVEAIMEAMAEGTRKYIVDLRGNGGGNSWAGQRLMHAMGITVPSYGAFRRKSDLALEQKNDEWLPGSDRIEFIPNISTADNPYNVFC
jgi:hypothetical protein